MTIPINELIVDEIIINKFKKNIKNKSNLLIYGPTGIGKTTCIKTLCHQYKRKIIYVDIELESFQKYKPTIFSLSNKEVILLDNLEELTDNNIKKIIDFFIKDPRPVIMITTELTFNLKKYNIPSIYFTFNPRDWVNFLEKKYSKPRKFIKQIVRITTENRGTCINQLNLNLQIDKIDKKPTQNDIYQNVFSKKVNKENYYFEEPTLHVFVWENYLNLKPNNLEWCNNTASACAITDVLETYYKEKQNYSLVPYINIFSTQMATFNYDTTIKRAYFPNYYGKIKKKLNNLKLENLLKE